MLLPLLLICSAVTAIGVVTYGTDPAWAQFSHGIQIIMMSRRLQWPLVLVCLLLCGTLLGLIVAGRVRAWWAIGLVVVLALFVRQFSTVFHAPIHLIESPPFVEAGRAGAFVSSDEQVAGFSLAGKWYALPYHQLSACPLISISDMEQRVVVIWSATAHALTVIPMNRDSSPRELEVVSTPADSLLLFDRRLGQFIVGVTGRTPAGAIPSGMLPPIAVSKVRFDAWSSAHPETNVMAINAPSSLQTVSPKFKFPTDHTTARDRQVEIIATTPPIAVPSDIFLTTPRNLTFGKTCLLLFRSTADAPIRAFDRQTADDLFLTFTLAKHPDKKHGTGVWTDADSHSVWTADGKAIDGPLKGTQLHEYVVRGDLYWGVMKFWIPQLQWCEK